MSRLVRRFVPIAAGSLIGGLLFSACSDTPTEQQVPNTIETRGTLQAQGPIPASSYTVGSVFAPSRPVEADGSFHTMVSSKRPGLIVASVNNSPMLLGLAGGTSGAALEVSARTTAIALLMLNPLLAHPSPELVTELGSVTASLPEFQGLVSGIAAGLIRGQSLVENPDIVPALRVANEALEVRLLDLAIERGATSTVSPDRSNSSGLYYVLPSTRESGVEVTIPPNASDGVIDITIRNHYVRWVDVYRIPLDATGTPESANGARVARLASADYSPQITLSAIVSLIRGDLPLGPTESQPVSLDFQSVPNGFVLAAYGFGLQNAAADLVALGEEDGAARWALPAALTFVFNYLVPIIELASSVEVPSDEACVTGATDLLSSVGDAISGQEATVLLAAGETEQALQSLIDYVLDLGGGALGGVVECLLADLPAASADFVMSKVLTPIAVWNGAWTLFDLGATTYGVTRSEPRQDFRVARSTSTSARLYGRVVHTLTGAPIAGATVSVSPDGIQVTTDGQGSFSVTGIPAGSHRMVASALGYAPVEAQDVRVGDVVTDDVVRVDFGLTPTTSTRRFSGIAGRIVSNNQLPLSGATVAITGGVQTNGIFRSSTSGDDGTFAIPDIPLDAVDGTPITNLAIVWGKPGFVASGASLALPGNNRVLTNQRLVLTAGPDAPAIWAESFESVSSWILSGMWNVIANGSVQNTALPTFVRLAQGDESQGFLPASADGTRSLWFGDASRGNFMGQQASGDAPGSGGTSVAPVSGIATSPSIVVPATAIAPTLLFETWYEIESVNPNQNGYDLMIVEVSANGGAYQLLGKLNPYVDPTLPERKAVPFTSGGFDRPPGWIPVEADLSGFRGQTIRIRFRFESVDHLYNGFRGWLVDRVRLTEFPTRQAQHSLLLSADVSPAALPPVTPRGVRTGAGLR